jgi:hypothetical protein
MIRHAIRIAILPLACACSAGSSNGGLPFFDEDGGGGSESDAGALDGGSGGASGGSAIDGGTSGGPRDAGRNDAGGSPGGGDAGAGGTPTRGGGVYLTSWDYAIGSTPARGYSASAAFVRAYPTATGGSCTSTTSGDCVLYRCPVASSAADAGAAAPGASAGAISVTGGASPLRLVPSGGSYAALTGQARLWSGGEALTITADGAEVPAFTLRATAPSVLTVTSPVFPAAGGSVVVARSRAFAVSWTGGAAGSVSANVGAVSASTSTSILCTFPASSGAGSVPASLLAQLPSPATSAYVSITGSATAAAVVGGWDVRATLTTLARTASGSATAAATIQ